jgi:uncharacterized membrane protein
MNARANLLAGAAVIVPLVVTFFVLRFLFETLDSILQPLLPYVFDRVVPGLGIAVLILLVYIVGLVARTVVGRWFTGLPDRVIGRVPLAGTIYTATRRLVESFGTAGKVAFKRAVILEYPRAGLRTIGFVTGETVSETDRLSYLNIFVPTPPNPTSGVMVLVRHEDVKDLSVSLEEAVQMVFSGGVVTPEQSLW